MHNRLTHAALAGCSYVPGIDNIKLLAARLPMPRPYLSSSFIPVARGLRKTEKSKAHHGGTEARRKSESWEIGIGYLVIWCLTEYHLRLLAFLRITMTKFPLFLRKLSAPIRANPR